jgi:RNA polymerase sigma-70 factor (ECF subfamily)
MAARAPQWQLGHLNGSSGTSMADSAAFEILYQEYYPRVFALCRFLLPSSDYAEDAARETFTRAYKAFDQYTPSRPFWQWIAAIAHRHCVDQLRLRGR